LNDLSTILKCINKSVSPDEFRKGVLSAFLFQKQKNPVYNEFLAHMGKMEQDVNEIFEIPFLPVSFFKNRKIIIEDKEAETIFRSSAITGSKPSEHHIAYISLYQKSLNESFRFAFGKPSEYIFVALLPSYLERKDSSLVFMMNEMMEQSRNPLNGFYLNELGKLAETLMFINENAQPCIFIGVSFALHTFAEKYPMVLNDNIVVIETGGMKGRSNDISRTALHENLCKAFGKSDIAGEYGMTELLSQSYSLSGGIYKAPPWVKVFARDLHDPLQTLGPGESGALNVIDLANIYSCPFIATDDTGRVFEDGSFEVTGRVSDSDIRGCNLMV